MQQKTTGKLTLSTVSAKRVHFFPWRKYQFLITVWLPLQAHLLTPHSSFASNSWSSPTSRLALTPSFSQTQLDSDTSSVDTQCDDHDSKVAYNLFCLFLPIMLWCSAHKDYLLCSKLCSRIRVVLSLLSAWTNHYLK